MGTIEKFLILLFTAIIFGLILTNPRGVSEFFHGIAGFTSSTVTAFSGGRGLAVSGY